VSAVEYAIDSDDGNPALRAKAKRALRSWLDRLAAIITTGQQRGEVKRNIDPENWRI